MIIPEHTFYLQINIKEETFEKQCELYYVIRQTFLFAIYI